MNFAIDTLRHHGLAVLAGLAFVLPSLAAEPGVSAREIVIGQNITLQGGKNAYGVAAAQGAKVYFDAINAAGGVNGRQIVVKVRDDDNQNATAEANARKLVQEGVFLLFGPIEGGPSSAVMKVAAETRVPLFGPMAGPPTLRRPFQDMVFPVRAEHREEFRALMAYAKTLGMSSVGFFHADSEGGRLHVTNVRAMAKDFGLEVRTLLPFKSDTTDEQIDAMVAQLGREKPDMVFNHGSPGLYQKLVAKMRQAGLKTVAMGVNSGSSQIAKGLGPLAQGMVFAQVVPSPWERKRAITREYQDAMRKARPDAEFSYGSLEGFLTAKALVMALQAAGKEPTRAGFAAALEGERFDLGGVQLRYARGEHEGSRFIDLSLVSRDGRFMH